MGNTGNLTIVQKTLAFHLEIKVIESGGRAEEAQNASFLKSSVESLQSVMICGAMSSLVLVHCFY